MTDAALKAHAHQPDTQEIVVDELFPHAPEVIWKTLTNGALMGRWLMAPSGFAPTVGNRFTYQTKPAGAWDGTIHCEVLDVVPNRRFAYAWKGGHDSNEGYGAPLETVVTFTLTPTGTGTHLRMEQAGFKPDQKQAYGGAKAGWQQFFTKLEKLVAEQG